MASFEATKAKILSALAVPDIEYSDLSPKGSVDVRIRDLIAEINLIEGLVTTSSCAGRVSVYVEGVKKEKEKGKKDSKETSDDAQGAPMEMTGSIQNEEEQGMSAILAAATSSTASAGGKGGGGYWAFVSHDPVSFNEDGTFSGGDDSDPAVSKASLHELFGLVASQSSSSALDMGIGLQESSIPSSPRLIKIRFEPLILHVLCASLPHASHLLSAAQSSGFRESGLQSPKALLSTPSSNPPTHPIIAIRTNGLSLESVIGYVEESPDGTVTNLSIVSEAVLRLLLGVANERFDANMERITRLREALKKEFASGDEANAERKGKNGKNGVEWEDIETRRARMKMEGLARREAERERKAKEESEMRKKESLEAMVPVMEPGTVIGGVVDAEVEMEVDAEMAGEA